MITRWKNPLILFAALAVAGTAVAEELVLADFEDNNFRNANGWKTEGEAFNIDLASGTQRMKRRVGPFEGKVFLTTLHRSDTETGRLTSPEVLLERDYLSFTMSGGRFPQEVGINLRIDDKLVRDCHRKQRRLLRVAGLRCARIQRSKRHARTD